MDLCQRRQPNVEVVAGARVRLGRGPNLTVCQPSHPYQVRQLIRGLQRRYPMGQHLQGQQHEAGSCNPRSPLPQLLTHHRTDTHTPAPISKAPIQWRMPTASPSSHQDNSGTMAKANAKKG